MKVSVVIVTYNSAQYISRLFDSLFHQTIFEDMEVIVMDNGSTDDSVALCRKHSADWPRPAIVEALDKNHGYAVATNLGVRRSAGMYICSLNADTWLEQDCLEQLLNAIENSDSVAGCSAQAELESNILMPSAPMGFDIFGRPTWSETDHTGECEKQGWHHCFMVAGAAFIVRRDVWNKIGGFDDAHFMYGEDDDVSWKLWLAGYQSVYVHKSVIHHRSHRSLEIKEFTRYLVNRNSLLVIAKNAQNILLLCWWLQVLMLLAESVLMLGISRSWKFVCNSYLKAITDCIKMWRHIFKMRSLNQKFRKRSDWKMARLFLRARVNRWDMVKSFLTGGPRPTVKMS